MSDEQETTESEAEGGLLDTLTDLAAPLMPRALGMILADTGVATDFAAKIAEATRDED